MNMRPCDMLRRLKSLPLLVALAGCARPGPRTEPIHDGPAEAPFPYAAPEEVGLSTESLTELAALVRGWTRDTVIVGAEILVVKDGRTVLHEAAGWMDLEAGKPMRKNSIFRLLAMTKPFTGTAALMLVEEGKLDLDAPVSRWLSSWANKRSGEITVRHLLTHTGGWEQYGTPRPLESYASLRDMVDDAGEHGPQHRPGEAYRYSDVHSYALGALVEEVSGVPVERFIEERILEPLDLVDTHTRFVSDTAWVDRVASRYRLQDDGWEKVWSPEQPQTDPFFRASGGLFSTATDYARWLEAWMEWIGAPPDTTGEEARASEAASPEVPRLLSMRTARAAVTPAVGPYGFHWEIFSDDPLVFGHGGVDGTQAMAIPSLDVMVVYLTQSQGREMRGRWPRAALDAVAPGLDLRRPLASVPAEKSGLDVVELTLAQRARYAGRYRAGSFTVRIFEEGGRLQRRLPTAGAPAVTLVPLGDHTFAMGRHEGDRLTDVVLPLQWLRFVVEDGRATALELVHDEEVRAVLQRLSPAAGPKDEAAGSDTVHVAPPTGEMEDVDAPGTTTRHPELGEVAYESSFVQVRGIRMHYLDFGGPGLPVIFIHGSHANARSFVDFAPRFADSFRVLALDRRGHGESENVDWGHGTAAQAEDILGLMDALGLQRAVLIDGNVGLTTYLGEHHPDRLEGIVFLRHMAPEVESRRDSSTAEFWDMASRTACDWDEETRQRNTQRDGYRPHFIDDPDVRIDVPALSLANADGTRLPEDFDAVGIFLEQVETGEWCDTTAKAYFSALAADTARATELRNRLGDLTGAANLSTFERAFGPRLTVVRLSVPAVSGYEYLRAPDLIYPHIRTFLEGLVGGDP